MVSPPFGTGRGTAEPGEEPLQHMNAPAHLHGGYLQAVHLALDAAANGLEGLPVVAALQHDVLAAAGQNLPAALLVPDTGHEPLAQLLPVTVLEKLRVTGDVVLLENSGDFAGADSHIGKQCVQNFILRLRRQNGPAGRACGFLRHRSFPSFFFKFGFF